MEATMSFLFIIATVPICGAIMAATPWLTPKRECFAVTVPESAQNDPQIKAIKRRFALWCALISVIGTLVVAGAASWAMRSAFNPDAANAFTAILVATVLAVAFVPFAFMLHFRKQVMAVKQERGWVAPRKQAAAVVAEADVPRAIPLAWNLLYVPVALVIIALGVIAYPHMPDMIPMHADFDGNVNRYAPKSIATVFGFPVAVVAFMAACFAFSHWGMLRSKRPTDPSAPATSALAYGLFARAQSVFLLATGLLMTTAIGVGFMLSSAGVITLGQCAAFIIIACVPVLIGAIALTFIYGQSGSRLFRRMQTTNGDGDAIMPADDDEHWKLGIFYFNPDDPSIWIPERFGVGWTFNFARPAAWACIVGFVAFTTVMVIVCVALAG